jgi:thiamine pyrophosphate-dependent acetolactate synthase large subunit-like protein
VPGIRYDQLAIAQGCPGERVTDAQGLHAVLEAALARKGCSLVEVVIG